MIWLIFIYIKLLFILKILALQAKIAISEDYLEQYRFLFFKLYFALSILYSCFLKNSIFLISRKMLFRKASNGYFILVITRFYLY